ncbi:MAG: alpha/beta hydrolase [Roseiarcus sp.]
MMLFAAALAALYVAVVAGLYAWQRALVYFPNSAERPPGEVGLAEATRLHLTTDDGERLLVWFLAPAPGKPLIVYFHGNGGGIDRRAERFAAFAAAGFGVLAVEYRGYGGSTGRPSEAGLHRDAEAGYREALSRVEPSRIVILGESLGSGVAVALAARHEVAALVLDSPFTSLADVAAMRFPIFPVRSLMRDRYDSAALISRVTAPLLIVHGTRDLTVPYRLGRRLFEFVNAPKTFIAVEGAGHLALGLRLRETIAWIDRAGGG